MWKNLDAFLSADASLELDATGSLSSNELLVAVLAVLMKASQSDAELGNLEVERSVEAAAREFGLDESQVQPSVEVAAFLAKDSEKLETLAENLRSTLNEPQKVEVLKAVWKVIRADSKISKKEASFAADFRKLLGLSMEQALFAAKA